MSKSGYSENDKSESGLSWGFEIESLVLGILGDADEIEEKIVLDLLMKVPELQPLLVRFAEHKGDHLLVSKKFGVHRNNSIQTVREELATLLRDVTGGPWHEVPTGGFGAHQKLCRWIIRDGDTEYIVIKRVEDESNKIKKS